MSDLDRTDLPVARTTEVVAETIGAETVVYDGRSKEAHCLAPLAAVVFAAADGRTSVAGLAAIAGAKLDEAIDVNAVELALAELDDRGLLDAPQGGGVSRRNLLRRGALVGGAALATPLVVSLVTPEYGAASSLSSLSYVVMVFKDSSGKYYRVKVGGDGTTVCGWSFATPGTDCTPPAPAAANRSDNCVPGLSVNESANGSQTQVTISWSNTGGLKLVDVRVKCSNECHVVLQNGNAGNCSGGTCSYGPFIGCP
ncbi:MAG TPA: hypothetical protein VH247_02290 [Thermoleophilaceae bacterium]|jgi:hypothetical protein|nr:hypothetical protein [Thermoleophilaceae bacterium]